MKKLKKILSVLALIVLVGSDFLTSISYALDDMLDDSVVVQIENEEAESVENEEENVNEEGSEAVYEDENMEEEKLETENSAGDIIEEWTGEVSEIGSGEVKELTEETVEGITGDVEGVTGDVEELTGEVVESTEIGEETVIEDMTYNEEPITGEKTYNDVTVRVEALSGTFPEGTELKIEPIKWWNLSSLKDKLVEEKEEIKEDTTIVAFDITFRYEGEEVQPKDGEKVKVTFDYSHNEDLVKADKNENQEVSVYHIDDETNEGTEIDIVNKDGDEVEILATEFSTYTIVVQRLEETPEGQPTQTRKYGKDYFIISIAKPSSITETGLPEGIIIMDRNLGATATGYGDGASTDSYGYKYQWGNNYGFSDSATVIPIDTCLSWNSNYNHNGYVSKDWINGSNCNNDVWGSTSADHYDGIWGGENDNIDNRQGVKLRNYAERQGPCPSGWHVPSAGEWGLLIKYWGDRTGAVVNNGYDISSNRNNRLFSLGDKFSEFQQYFNLPFAGRRLISNANLIDESVGHYWSSSPSVDSNLASNLYLGPSAVSVSKNIDIPRGLGYSVRCFKDDYVVPKTNDVTFEPENGSGATTVQVEDGETTTALNPEPTKDGYAFLGWYLSGAESAFDFTGTAITGDITLYAKWPADFVWYETIDDVDVNVNINAKGGTFPEGTELFIELVSQDRHDEIHTALVNDMGKNLELLAFDIYFMSGGVKQQPTTGVLVKLNYEGNPEFQGASLSDLSLYHIDGTTHELEPIEIVSKNGDEIEFWATEFSEYLFVLQEGEYIVSFVSDDVEVGSGIAVSGNVYTGIIPTPTKDGYNFSGWYTSEDDGQTLSDTVFDFDTPITTDITLYAKWSKNRRITDQMPNFTWGEISIPRPKSISTGHDYYIIMDRNLGATSSGTVCDTGSNNGTCGLLYQFGNNYGFSYDNINMAEKCNEKSVDLNEYSPSNPYYDSAFIYGKKKCNNTGTDTDWAAISNYNIWGGQNGSYTDRQGPCPDEWHLPTQKEWEEAINYWTVGESDQGTGVLNSSNIDNFRDYFQLPFAGGRSRSDGKISHVGAQGSYDTAQTNKGAPYILRITTTGGIVDSNTTYNQVNGYSIRCFKNIYEEEYYTVTFKNRDGDILRSGEVLAGKTPVYSGSQPSRPATEESVYSFNGWYPEITPVTSDVVYTATYDENPRLYTVTLTGTPTGYGTLTPESLTKEYGTTIVISGDKLTVGGTEVILTGNEGYEFQEWTGTCEKIEKQVCDEFTVYSHSEPIEFTGGNNLIITNPGYDLFSESNYQKDFEISFDIVEQNLSSSVSQATILNVKDEDQEDIWPGFVIRKSGTAGKIEISATSDYGEGFQTKSYSLENLHNMKISRINSILYVSINGEANQEIYDYSGFYNYFTKPIVFGSSYKDSNHLFRPAKITLSNILIKSADNCYTGNVYIVTGDCQMTAAFSASDSHEVRIASNNTGYGTVSTESVTKPHGTSIIDNENGTLTIDDVTVTVTTGTAPAGHTYTFSGWTFSSECGSKGNYVVAEGCTITGNFEDILNTYTVTFDLSEGSLTGDMTLTKNYTIETPSISLIDYEPERNGYTFTGWYRDGTLITSMAGGETGDYTLVARWEAQERPIPVVVFMKMLVPGEYTDYDSNLEWGWGTVGELYTAPIEQFTHTGFYYEEDNENNVRSVIVSPNVDNEVHLYFSRIPYPLIITNAGEGISSTTTGGGDHLYEEPVTISVTPYTGWDFVSWSLSQGTLSGVNDLTQRTLSFNMPAEQVMISPILNHIEYTLSFDSASGTAVENQTYYYNDLLSGLDNAITTRTGYDFSGWYLSGVLYTSGSTMPAEDITLTAVWDINEYEVDASVATGGEGYLSGMGSTGISLTGLYDYATELVFIAIPELGYVFDYWEINGNRELPEGATTGENQLTIVINQILDIVAHFTENAKTVTVNYYEMNTGGFYPNEPYITNSLTGLVGQEKIINPESRMGFHLDNELSNTGVTISENSGDNVINIYYARDKHYITLGYTGAFVNPNSVEVKPTSSESGYYYGENVHFEAIVSTGYVFKQWRKNGNPIAGNADGVDFVMGDENVNLVVDGDLISYNIDYYTEPGYSDPLNENPQTYTVLSGEIEIHKPIAEFCNNFLGWTGGTAGDWISTPTTGLVIDASKGGDRKYYANWERKSYEVELSVEPSSGGTVTGAGTYRCMGTIELHATPNTGYHFEGWYDDGGNLVSSNEMYVFRAPEGSLGTGLTARFAINQYYVTIDKNGSGYFQRDSAPSGRYYHGTPITFFASPSYGYKIQKWSKNRQNITTGENDQLYTGFILDVIVTETGNYEVYFEPETYNIIYMDSGSILTGLSPATYTIENHVYSGDLPSITKDGYNFAGWFYEYPRQPENQIQEIGYVPVDGQSVTILAGWMPIDYNINYHLLTGVEIIPWEEYYPYEFYQSYNIETTRTDLPNVQKSGYIFSGWVDYHGKSFTGFGGGMTGDLDLYPTWRSDVMDITVNYYEMNTGGEYYPSSWAYYETYHYTGFTNSEFIAPDYTTTGFHLDWNKHPNGNPSIVISGDKNVNIIDVYYEREKYYLERVGLESCIDNDCITFATVTPDTGSIYYGEEIRADIQYNEGWSFSGWYNDDHNNMQLPDEVDDLTSEHIVFHMPARNVKIYPIMDHILYKLTFTGYEGAEVTNSDVAYASLTGENYYRFDSEIELPYLDKPGYNFIGWNSGDYNIWSIYYSSNPNHPIRHMPSHDVELTAVFEPKTDMEYNEYYYLQDVEGTGYSRDDELTQRKYDGTTEQQIPYPYPQKYITGFEYTGFGYDEKALRPWEEWPIIKATGDNYINYYYDRKVDGVYVEYDNKKMFITGTGEYRYGAPVNLIAVVKTGYEFSGFTSYQGELLSSGSVYNFTMPDSYVYLYADANPIVYSIDYEMNGGYFVPYNWAKTGYTVDGDFDLDIFDAGKEGYTFLGWTGGVIGVRELTEPTTGLIIPLGSTGNRKYFANFEATGSNVTVNYYLKKIDPENNVLTGGVDEYISKGVVYTGLTDSVVDISALYGTGIEGYEYTTAIVYGSDSMDGIETGTTTILGDGTRSIDIYYTPKKYNFTVIQGQNTTTSGTSISTGYYFGAYVTLSGDSTEDCFGWNNWGSSDLPEGKNQQHTTFEMPAHNVTVESMVSEKSYNIVFDANGGTGTMSTLSVQCTSGTLSPNNFERNGYTFTGWSRNSNGPVEFTGGSNIHRLSTTSGGEVTLFAIWDFNEYTVTGTVAEGQENMGYLSGSTATGSSLTGLYDYGTELIFIAVPELGYLFDYWEVTGSGDSQPIVTESGNQLKVVVDQILDIVAHFTENAKTVTVNYYEMNTGGVYPGVTNSTTFTGLVGHTGYATINIPYGFHLDTTQTTSTGIVISNNNSENVIDVYYARNQHQLNKFYSGDFQYNYNLVDFNPVLKQYYYYGEHIYTNVIAHTGYSVNNLTCSGGDNINIHGTEIEFDMGDEDATIIIDGSKNRYRIDYYLDGGIENPAEPNVTGYTIIDGSIQIHDPIKTGYNFLGWTGGMSGDWISTPTSGLIIDVENGLGDRQYYANWTGMEYIVTLYVEPETGGTVYGSGVYHYGDLISVWAMTNEGYDFTGWYTYEGYNKISDYYQIGLQADDSGGTGLIAKFELRNYLVHISSTPYKGSSRPQGDNYYQHGSQITVTAEPYEGYNVKNWMVNGRERKTGDNERYTGLTLDMTITYPTNIDIDFEPKPYSITYMSGDTILTGLSPNTYDIETLICDENYIYEYGSSCMHYLPTLTRDGYDFTGWYNNPRISSYDRIEVLSGMGDRTIYAGFIPIIYRVYYHLGSGETLPEWYIDNYDEYTIESGRTYLPEPKKQGYDFLGWKNDNNQIITGFGGGMTGNLDLYPVWTGKVMDIEVRYYEMDINGNYNYYTHYDYTGITNSVFNVPDYTTTGFILDGIMHPSGNPSIVVSGNNDANIIDVYYEREEYEITTGVSEHGSVSGETGSQKYGKVITFTAHPEIGYILDKWFKNGEEIEGETENELTLTVEEGMEISGHFIAATGTEYRVEYYYQNAEDGSYPSSATSGEIRKGTTDTIAEVMTGDKNPTVSGYSFDSENEKNVLSGNINGSGDLVLKVYFKKQFTVKYLTGDKGLFDIEIYEGLDYSGNTPEFVGNTGDHMPGYTFNGWRPEVSEKVTKDEDYVAQWIANTGTEYKVEYYKENLEGGYDVWTGIQYGTSDTQGVAQELSFEGFTYNSGDERNVTIGNIDGDGSRVLKLYYNREIYTITRLNEDGTDMDTTSVKYGEVPTHADPTQPADAHYTYKFKGWNPEPTFATGEISYRATYEHIVNKHTITWKNDDGSVIDKTMVEYGTIPTHTKPTKAETEDYRYVFAGWDPEVVAVVGDAEYTAVFNAEEKEKSSKGGGMSGGGGRGGNIDSDDNQHGSAEENSDGDEYIGDEVVDNIDKDIDRDIVPLYKRTYENDITTMDTLEYADPDGLLTRGHLAKMVVNYMVNVLGRKIPYDVTYNCRYWGDDESSRESDEIRDYATKACAFGVMGINMEDNKFLPNSIVTRAEFGTVMSRVLRGDKYDITDTDNRSYYENHLQALKKDNILTQIANPETRWEIRKWVWLVFRRIVEKYKK